MKFTAAALALLTLGTAAQAGGRVVPVEPLVIAPSVQHQVHNWTGAYAGIGIGYGQGRHTTAAPVPPNLFPDSRGGVGSVLLGYNWQGAGNFVVGGEVMIAGGRMAGTTGCGLASTCTSNIGAMAAARLRLGVAMDRTLAFMTVGVANASVRYGISGGGGADSASARVNGWTVGIGLEHAMTNGWNLRGDLEHYRFNTGSFTFPVIGATIQSRTQANVARLTLVRRF